MSESDLNNDELGDQAAGGDSQPPADDQAPADGQPPADDVVVETAPVEDAAPVVSEAPPPPPPGLTSGMIDPKLRDEFDLITEQFERYSKNMAKSRPIEEADGVRQQLDLWKLIQTTISKEGTAFNVLFAHLLELMHGERDGALHMHRRYRFFGALPLGAEEARNFESILQAFMTLANPQSRMLKIKQVNLPAVFLNYSNKSAEARVIDFFTL